MCVGARTPCAPPRAWLTVPAVRWYTQPVASVVVGMAPPVVVMLAEVAAAAVGVVVVVVPAVPGVAVAVVAAVAQLASAGRT